MSIELGEFSLDRVVNAVEKVRQRLLRAVAALQAQNILYAVAGGNAVALWVSRVDESAVRNTQDVDILIRREDFSKAKAALEHVGFVYRHTAGLDIFLDGPDAKARNAVHLIFAKEMVRPGEAMPNPDVIESEEGEHYRVLALDALVRIKLTAYRDKDKVHLRDLIDVGLIDRNWLQRFPPELAARLENLLNDPNG